MWFGLEFGQQSYAAGLPGYASRCNHVVAANERTSGSSGANPCAQRLQRLPAYDLKPLRMEAW